MGTDYIKYYSDLQQELSEAKVTLENLNDSIRRQHRFTPRIDKIKSTEIKKHDGIDRNAGTKRRSNETKSVFNRLSAPVSRSSDEESRPRLTSRVIRELPSRQEIVEAQGVDSESRARNRRMFGSLLGTLHKFCQEESRLKQKEDKKAQIEKKLEEQALLERESMKRERESLFLDRRRKQIEIRRLELKMNRMKDFEVWESYTRFTMNHIRTKTKPYIFFKPKVWSRQTELALANSQTIMKEMIELKRIDLNLELEQIENDTKVNDMLPDDSGHLYNTKTTTIMEDKQLSDDVESMRNDDHRDDKKINHKKDDADSKENKLRNNEPLLHSSVVVVRTTANNCNT